MINNLIKQIMCMFNTHENNYFGCLFRSFVACKKRNDLTDMAIINAPNVTLGLQRCAKTKRSQLKVYYISFSFHLVSVVGVHFSAL